MMRMLKTVKYKSKICSYNRKCFLASSVCVLIEISIGVSSIIFILKKRYIQIFFRIFLNILDQFIGIH